MGFIFIDSQNIIDQEHFNFKVDLSNKITINQWIKLTQANIVFDEVLIRQGTSFLTGSCAFKINDRLYLINTGNYSLQSLIDMINFLFQKNQPLITCMLFTSSQYIRFQATLPFTLELSDELKIILGFKKNNYSGQNCYDGECTPTINNPNNIFIQVNELINSETTFVKGGEVTCQFIIPFCAQRGNINQYSNISDENKIYMTKSIDTMTIKILKNNSDFFQTKSSIQLKFEYC